MKIETSNTSGGDVVPPAIASIIERIKAASTPKHFVDELNKARSLQTILAKTELYRWVDVLNRCDDILADAVTIDKFRMRVDHCQWAKVATISVLRFTSLLFECSSTRRIYSSTDRLIGLLQASDLDIVTEVLKLLQTISKRSKFLNQRLCPTEQSTLVNCLTAVAQCWDGKIRGVKMTECISPSAVIPPLFPFSYTDEANNAASLNTKPKDDVSLLSIVDRICKSMDADNKFCVLARLRMRRNFDDHLHRMQCVIVRLLSISTLIHCRCQHDESQIIALLYSDFIEDTVNLLKEDFSQHPLLDQIQTEALRTLTSIVSLDKQPMIHQILDCLTANSYHGFLAVFTRSIVDHLKLNQLGTPGRPSIALGTSLFSFIYHISSVDNGGEHLVSSGLTLTLLSVLEYKELPIEQISFATRCSRIIDIFTTIDAAPFNTCKGMGIFIDRLVFEAGECRKDQPFVIDTSADVDSDDFNYTPVKSPVLDKRCHQQRSGLIKGLLTFIKRAIQEAPLQESTRLIMDGPLVEALIHIISNAEYYSDSIYHHALQLVTNFIYQEPAQLTQLQEKHLPYVILQSMLRKEIPNSRDVIQNMGNVFTALCLNEAGLKQFKSYKPFDHVFKILLSIKFIATMKKKRNEMNDSAQGIGTSLEDLLRHQPTLKPLMLDSLLTVLDLLIDIGTNPPVNTKVVMNLPRAASKAASQNFGTNSGGVTPEAEVNVDGERMDEDAFDDYLEEDDDEDAELSMDEMPVIRPPPMIEKMGLEMDCPLEPNSNQRVLPLGEYLIVFTKVFETFITQVNVADMIEGFVSRQGLDKLLKLTQLPTLVTELHASHFCQNIAAILLFILQHQGTAEAMMTVILNMFEENVGFLLQPGPEQGSSYLVHHGKAKLTSALLFLNGVGPILQHLAKNTFGGNQMYSDRRNKVQEAFLTDSGKCLLTKLRKVSRLLTWEHTLVRLIEPVKVVASTQTDPEEEPNASNAASNEIDATTINVVSVATEKPAPPSQEHEKGGILDSEVEFWNDNRQLADSLNKASKAVTTLLNVIPRSCHQQLRRNRRYDYNLYPMNKSATSVADFTFAGIYRDLKWKPSKLPSSSMEFGRIYCVLSQLNGVLFDDRRSPYHGMIEKFYSSGCHQAFCDLMTERLAPAMESKISRSLEEAFNEWFFLAERLSNKTKMINSPHKTSSVFDPDKYTKLVHNDLFRCLSALFIRLSSEDVDLRNFQSLCESAINVYKEVAQSLVPIEAPSTPPPQEERRTLEEDIQQLVEMGCSREDAVRALTNSAGGPHEAAEWLFTNPRHPPFVDTVRDFVREDEAGAVSDGSGRNSTAMEVDEEDGVAAPIIVPLRDLNINKDVSISQACVELMPLCKRLMQVGSDLVYPCADLVNGVIDSLDETWKKSQLINTMMSEEIIEMARKVVSSPTEDNVKFLATRIHFVCLLFERMAEDYLQMISQQPLVSTLLLLLGTVYAQFDLPFMRNLLLPPVVLWLDLYDKCSRALKRRKLLEKLVPSKTLKWSYFGDENERYPSSRNKKWNPYPQCTQKIINTAFFSGKPKISIQKKDKEFVVDFGSLSQKENDVFKYEVHADIPDAPVMDLVSIIESEKESIWTEAEKVDLLMQLVRLLHKKTIHHTAAHSLLSFVARLTQDKECALAFLQQGGVMAVVKLQSADSPCTSSLVSLILRHCIDTEVLYKGICERTIRQVATPAKRDYIQDYGMTDTKPKDWQEALGKLMPLAVKKPDIFMSCFEKLAKMTNNGNNIQYIGKGIKPVTDVNNEMEQIVSFLLREALNGEWPEVTDTEQKRMLSRGTILSLLAELVRSYPGVATVISETKEQGKSIILQLLDKHLDGKDKDTIRALKFLIAVLAGCNHSPKAQEQLVVDIKEALCSISTTSSCAPNVVCSKVDQFCQIIIFMIEPQPYAYSQTIRPGHQPNAIMKLFHKKKICNDLVKTITFLQFNQKETVDTINQVLRTLEVLMRSLNTPPSGSEHQGVLLRMENRMELIRTLNYRDRLLHGFLDEDEEHTNDFNDDTENADNVMDDAPPPLREALEHMPEEGHEEDEHNEDEEDDDDDNDDDDDDDDDEGDEDGEDSDADLLADAARHANGEDADDQVIRAMEDEEEEEEYDAINADSVDEGDDQAAANRADAIIEDDTEDEDNDNDDFHFHPRDAHRGFAAVYEEFDRPARGIDIDNFEMFPALGFGARRERQRPIVHEVQHPLLVRPQNNAEAHPPPQNPAGGARDYRLVFGAGGALALTRQNAIRRGSARIRAFAPSSQLFDRIFDLHHLTAAENDRSLLNILDLDSVPAPVLPSAIPTALDRLKEGFDLLDPVSIQYINILVKHIVSLCMQNKMIEEAANAAAAVVKTEEQAPDAEPRAAEDVTNQPVAEREEGALEAALRVAWGTAQQRVSAEMREDMPEEVQANEEEPMDVSREVVEAVNTESANAEMEDIPPNSSAATVASSIDEGEGDEQVPMEGVQESQPVDLSPGDVPADNVPQPAEPTAVPQPEPAPERQEVPEEYRHILGDIDLPPGVDPAFLAALPEDMRAEVIRDHERQQRAQRATVAPVVAPVAEGGAPAAAAIVEPLDQEFLAALPPDIQEEIIQQHERAVREAEEAIRRANAPPPVVEPEMDGAAVIASLPPSERAQVLADIEETELQRLPQNMQDEARRARVQFQNILQRNVMRMQSGIFGRAGSRFPPRRMVVRPSYLNVGNLAGKANTASAQAVQLLDREALLTLCGLFLMENRLSINRLQKVIRIVCSHPSSCDFVIWCLQALLDKATEAGADDDEETASGSPAWLESITVPGVGHNERCIKISKNGNKVSVHPLVCEPVCRNVLDALITLAKTYPGHFLPASLRQSESSTDTPHPPHELFWQMIQNPSSKVVKEPSEPRSLLESLKDSPVVQLTQHFNKKFVLKSNSLQDKLLRLLSVVIHTLPNDTPAKLKLEPTDCPLATELKMIIDVLTSGVCGSEGFSDGRSLLVEAMRAFSHPTSCFVYDQLCGAIEKIGLELKPQIDTLLEQLDNVPTDSPTSSSSSAPPEKTKGRVTSSRLAGESVVVDGDSYALKMLSSSCRELRLPAVTTLTDKGGAQYRLLSSLQTITKVRDTMRHMKDERAKKLKEEAEKKKEEEAKKKEEAEKKEEESQNKTEESSEQTPVEVSVSTQTTPVEASTSTAASASGDAPSAMDTDKPETSTEPVVEVTDESLTYQRIEKPEERLSRQLEGLEGMWVALSTCLNRLGKASDPHAVLALQPAAEAFFLVHAVPKGVSGVQDHPDTTRMIEFAEKHRGVLNQVLRQNNNSLGAGGPFSILTQFPKLLDFDVKRKYFRKELTKMEGDREYYRRSDFNVQVRRSQLFADSFRELFRLKPSDWKKRFYIVFQGEEGQDAGGLLREWFSVITREIFNPNYALFITAPGDMVTYMINKTSYINPEHLDYFKFVGRLIAKAIYDNKLLDCYFTRAFYKHILNLPVRYQDIESEDPAFFKSLEFLLNNPINDLALDLTFSLEVEEFGKRSIRDLKPGGAQIEVTDENKIEYVNLVCQMKMTGSIRKQLDAFLTGFHEVIPSKLISMFNEQELELLISGLPDVDIDDLANNTEYKGYQKTSPQIQWFWRALRSFEQEDRAKFLQFVTGTSKVPLQGFAALEGMNGVQKFSIHMDSRGGDRLPAAHTCFNQLDLPQYDSYEVLRDRLLVAIRECTEGFGFA